MAIEMKPQSLDSVRKRIKELERLDLSTASIDSLRSRINFLFKGYSWWTPEWEEGRVVYRGRKFSSHEEKPLSVKKLGYPQPDKVRVLQRANRPGCPLFYCSLSEEPAIFEIAPTLGDFLALSRWRFKRKTIIANVGFTADTFKSLGSSRTSPDWTRGLVGHPSSSLATRTVSSFLAKHFTQVITLGEEYRYKISIAIAENILNMTWQGGDQIDVAFGGLHYPSIAMKANSDNFALLPNFVDSDLELAEVDWIQVEEKLPDFKYQIKRIDYADSFSIDGTIEWKGRRRQWVLNPGALVRVAVENGKFKVTDTTGNTIEPT